VGSAPLGASPTVKSFSSRNERLSRANFLSIFIDKIRNMLYGLLSTEAVPLGPTWAGREKLCGYLKPSDHNLPREPARTEHFFI
jgi:hypothetical protein